MGGCAMRLVDRIRELCATAANTNDPVTAFQSLQELREIARDRDFRRDMEALIKEAPQKLTQNKRSILSFYCRKSTGALEVRHSTAKSPTMEIAASRSANKISHVASQSWS